MKIVVDRDRCESNGVCVRLVPEAFHLDDADRLQLRTEQVPPELRAKVDRAIRGCPKQALSLSED